jgi:hypothetical protein
MSGNFAIYPSLRDRVVFITGGASGIGAEHVTQFAEQGAKVAFVDIADDAARELAGKIEAASQQAPLYRHCDLKDIAALQRTIAEVGEQLGPITVLVNNGDRTLNPLKCHGFSLADPELEPNSNPAAQAGHGFASARTRFPSSVRNSAESPSSMSTAKFAASSAVAGRHTARPVRSIAC